MDREHSFSVPARMRLVAVDSGKVITIGICAMNAKTQAPPMQNILGRLMQHVFIRVIVFSDETILHSPVEQWPICDCIIAFYSKGFPLEKAIHYVRLRRPFVINDLQMQYDLMDRRQVYKILEENRIEVPKYVVLNRSEDGRGDELIETDDTIEVRGQVFHKPFVEKPVSAEDHNIYIYFPSDYGGGCQRLFRKVKDRSSRYSRESSVRSKGSYIYEEFKPTDGTDVKVYTVGPDYAHAEARKSPALDGKVERDELGKEKRYPVILTAQEKLIARQVCIAFKQTVCGFDLLRANGKSYVCDVNGFSFVKQSQKYYEDCSQILLEMITAELAPEHFPAIPPSVEYLAEEVPVPIPKTGNPLELRSVVGIIRHGDRTPKQKMKMIVNHKKFLELFEQLNGYKTGHLKLKKPKQLQKVLDIARYLLENIGECMDEEVEKTSHKLQQLRVVLEMHGRFSGINRKVQFRLLNKTEENGAPLLLLILKWGGELTPAGQKQAEELGRAFRCMYPGGEGEYSSLPGSGFLRLHSTYRHDLKVYASDEGRVQMTAAAFTKGLLDLEGNLASVLVHLVKRDQNATNMLDTSYDPQGTMLRVKERLHTLMRSPRDINDDFTELAPTEAESLVTALRHIKNPQKACEMLYQKIQALLVEITETLPFRIDQGVQLYHGETLQMMLRRWEKLEKDFKKKDGRFDISKIPDIYDCIKYDRLHNSHLCLKMSRELFECAMHLADVVIPQEYGITREEKLNIATQICTPLLKKIQADLHRIITKEYSDIIHRLDPRLSQDVVSPNRHVRSRLYFTSESHVHTILNILRYGGLVEDPTGSQWQRSMRKLGRAAELNYMTQIVIMLFEDVSQSEDSDLRYRVDIHFSTGVKGREGLLQEMNSPPVPRKESLDIQAKSSMWVRRLAVPMEPLQYYSAPTRMVHNSSDPVLTQMALNRKHSLPDVSLRSISDNELLLLKREHAVRAHGPLSGRGTLSDQSIDMEERAGKELAAELSSTIEPLVPLCSVTLKHVNAFLAKFTGIINPAPKPKIEPLSPTPRDYRLYFRSDTPVPV